MRLTNTSMVRNHMYDTQQNLTRMNGINEKINSGKEINRVSDDPHKAIRIMNLNNEIRYTEKYNYNIDEVVGWMETTDGALDDFGNTLNDIKKNILEVGNGVYNDEELKAIQAEMNEKIKDLGNVLNTTYAGKYMFGGTNVDEPPINILVDDETGVVTLQLNPNSNTDNLKADISDGINIDYNLSAGEIFTQEHLDAINSLSSTMNAMITGEKVQVKSDGTLEKNPDGTTKKVTVDKGKEREALNATIKGKVDKLANHALDERTSLGVRANTAEKVRELNDENILNMKGVLSLDQDVDHVEKFIELKSAELVYQASIQVGTKLIQPTILDYMR